MWAVLLLCMRMSPAYAQLRGCALCTACAASLCADCCSAVGSGHCLDEAALCGHGALGAARLSVEGWLGLDGGPEQ